MEEFVFDSRCVKSFGDLEYPIEYGGQCETLEIWVVAEDFGLSCLMRQWLAM